MLQKVWIILVMLVHVNGSMFLPQMAERDIYNAQGQQVKDIDTLFEYVDEVLLDIHDDGPVEKDNDDGQNFHLVSIVEYDFDQHLSPVHQKPAKLPLKNEFALYKEAKIPPVSLEILAPPPKA